jgi:hypothetical protein
VTYVVREIDLTFQLGRGPFGGTGFNQVKLTGLRVLAKITTLLNNTTVAGGLAAVLRIYGMTLDQMNQLTVAGLLYKYKDNLVLVEAGDAGAKKTTVFNGQIMEAFPDFTEAPNSAFVVSAITGRKIAMKPVAPVSFQGPTSAATVFQQIAQNSGLNLENNGVNAQLSSPYCAGTAMSQIAATARAADCYAHLDEPVILAKNSNRGGDVPVISPATGMIGYPSYEQIYIIVRTTFDPAVKFSGLIQVNTGGQLLQADGLWKVVFLDYNLASQMPDGPWEMTIKGVSQTTGKQ